MRTFFRVSMIALFMLAVVAVSNTTTYGQSEKNDLWTTITENYAGDLAQKKTALKAGKEFLDKFGTSEESHDKDFVAWLKPTLQGIEEDIKKVEDAAAAKKIADAAAALKQKRMDAFVNSYTANNMEAAFDAGKVLLDNYPELMDVSIILACSSYNESVKKKEKYYNLTVQYATEAIRQLEKNVPSAYGDYGGFSDCSFKTDTQPDGRSNALGWLNFYIGFVKYYRQDQPDAAMNYYYKATQYDSGSNSYSFTYRAIGYWYLKKTAAEIERRKPVAVSLNTEIEMTTQDVEKIKQLQEENNRLMALERGYADRAIDAFSRAYNNVEVANRNSADAKDLFTRLQEMYKVRYGDKVDMQTDSVISSNVSMIAAKTMPDPSSTVEPVFDGVTAPAPVETSTPDASKAGTGAGASRTRTVSQN